METGPALVLARGARQAEERLLAELTAALAAGRGERVLLARPLRVVVPSRRLREHLCAALVRRAGRSLVGIEVLTHLTLALRVLERAGEAPPRGEDFFALAVRRFARQEAVLGERLDRLEDGYGVVEATVRDLLDAGLDPAVHGEALDEFLSQTAADPAGARARAVLRVVSRTASELARLGFGEPSTLLRRASHCLARHGPALSPTRALWIHGFTDATGVVADWLELLQRSLGARTILSQPPLPGEPVPEEEFGARLRERLAAAAREERMEEPAPVPVLQVLRAPGATAELRAVAARIRALLDAGARPEGIAIVARNLEPYRAVLRGQLEQQAVPFSAPSLRAPGGPAARRAGALLELLARGERVPVDRWLDAHARDPGADLRTAFHAIGAGRLEDLARLDVAARLGDACALPLPVRWGLEPEQEDAETEPGDRRPRRITRRRVPRPALEHWCARAAGTARRLRRAARRASVEVHGQGLLRLLRSLGWRPGDEALQPVSAAIGQLVASLSGAPELDFDEWVLLLRRRLPSAVGIAVGGAGGGVQVLSVMEARALSFDHLFVIGLNRDVFPRPITEDALIPDALRVRLRSLLPDLPVKGEGHAEERHHFAELLAASPRVTLSWQALGDDGRERVESPLLVRLRLARGDIPEVRVAGPTGWPAPGEEWPATPRPLHEHVRLAGLHGSRRHFGRVLRVALAESQAELDDGADPGALAAARLAVLDELDPDLRTPRGRSLAASLGPYCGFVGASRVPERAEAPELPVTHLQRLAGCPWQAFLARDLGLEPAPDALDALPSVDPARLGRVVHGALQALVDERLGPSPPRELAAALAREAMPVPWPDPAALERILLDAAWRVVREDGIALEGLVRLLAHGARPFLEAARRRDWQPAGGVLPVLGTELDGAFDVRDAAGRQRRVGFRVDRVDRCGGRVRLSDYKTSRPFSSAASPDTRARHFAGAVREGRALQAPAYVEGALPLAGGLEVEGRYVFLRPEATDTTWEQRVEMADEPLRAQLRQVSRTVLAARDAGALFPRLVEARRDAEPRRCGYCTLRAACLRGESAHRRRLRAWARSGPDAAEEGGSLGAFRALWWLGADAGGDA